MRRLILLTALLAGAIIGPTTAGADPPRRDLGWPHDVSRRHLGEVTPHLAVGPGHRHPGPWQTTPWHYHPQWPCLPPWCLPAYHRHRAFFPAFRVVPLEAVLERLERLDYHSFGWVSLNGPNYSIEARNRDGRVVRLIVNAGNGQIRRILQ